MKKIALFFLSFLVFGCTNFLQIEPLQEVSIKQQLGNLTGVQQALNGAYKSTEDIVSDFSFLYPDVVAGNIRFTPTPSGSNTGVISIASDVDTSYSFTNTPLITNFSSTYANCYKAINNLNLILQYSSDLPDASVSEKNQIKAECLAMRGFLHFYLLQMYAQTYNYSANGSHLGIVYVTQTLQGGVDFPARKSVAECYNLIVSDLQNALPLFTGTSALSGPAYSMFNIISTKAFLSKVALQKQDYSLAVSLANDVIATSGISLLTASNYVSEWDKPSLPVSEVIFEMTAPVNSSGIVSSSVSSFYKYAAASNYGRYACSNDLYNLFDAQDIRRNCFKNQPLQVKIDATNFQTQTFYFTRKHQDNPGTIVLRLSEIYLIKAEALARLGNSSEALTTLNIIHQRANLPAFTSSVNILEEIFIERRKELCFESNFLYDTARFNKNIIRNLDCISILCNLNYPNFKFILPIPQQSISVNSNMIQNEGY